MEIKRIYTQEEWNAANVPATLAVWNFGPLSNLPADADDGEADRNDVVLLAVDNGETIGYLTGDVSGIWCIEVAPEHQGRGVARALIDASHMRVINETNAASAALADALGLEVA